MKMTRELSTEDDYDYYLSKITNLVSTKDNPGAIMKMAQLIPKNIPVDTNCMQMAYMSSTSHDTDTKTIY